ncbi:hypothetical protein OBBRIDRAFT_794597 [Obba rivulosa]|uniref:Cytokinin riboside 5'-monophosphate phosphoribohydrolase n=1 Tax=Obba rivulosa TaxID=1052685 RepID=A0A8E2AQI5_9APHY|nr:hypothetical protein OBBRIDRAFT_794597 [Obba rivulosa]
MTAQIQEQQDSVTTRAIAVFCASSQGTGEVYARTAESLGRAMAAADRPLVYGGGSKGVMGVVSGAVLEAGGHVTGVVPYAMLKAGGEVSQVEGKDMHSTNRIDLKEKGRERVETIVVHSMHERKLEMAKRSSAFICLPGGYGTLEETLEVISWLQLGIHDKPILVLNILGFYDPLRELIRNGVRAGFITARNEALVHFVDGPSAHEEHAEFDWGAAAIKALDNWKRPEHSHFYDWTVRIGGMGQGKGDAWSGA